jgi:hypothetical protein
MDYNKGLKVWRFFIIWFSIKYYIMTFYYGFPSCDTYECLINDVKLKDKTILYKLGYGILMSLGYGIMESALYFMLPYTKIYFLMHLYS